MAKDEFIPDDSYRLDDLQTNNLYLYQNPKEFCFGLDAVLLSAFAAKYTKENVKVLDMCTGNGIVAILFSSRKKKARITGVEINPKTASLAKYNIKYNHLQEYIDIIEGDVKSLPKSWNGSYDAVCANPPYIPIGRGLVSKDSLSVARHEIALSLPELIENASRMLKDKGKFFLVHKAHRTVEIIEIMARFHLEAKILQFIQPKKGEKANLVLICASKNSGAWVDIPPVIVVYDEFGNYTEQIQHIYNRDK